MTTIKRPVRLGRNLSGTAFLVADQDDLDRGEMNGPARIEYANGFVGEVMPSQQFYKFGNWLPDVGDEHEKRL